jgi:hypothetical protein
MFRAARKLPVPLSSVFSTTIVFPCGTGVFVDVVTFCGVGVKVGVDVDTGAGEQADRISTSTNNTEKYFIFILLLSML